MKVPVGMGFFGHGQLPRMNVATQPKVHAPCCYPLFSILAFIFLINVCFDFPHAPCDPTTEAVCECGGDEPILREYDKPLDLLISPEAAPSIAEIYLTPHSLVGEAKSPIVSRILTTLLPAQRPVLLI